MQAAEILAEYGLKPSDIVEWPAIAPNDTENLHRLARVFVMNRHLQTQSGCEPLVWKPLPPVEDPEEKKCRDAAGLLPAEWDSIKVCTVDSFAPHIWGQLTFFVMVGSSRNSMRDRAITLCIWLHAAQVSLKKGLASAW